jgi:hypothetical protein
MEEVTVDNSKSPEPVLPDFTEEKLKTINMPKAFSL